VPIYALGDLVPDIHPTAYIHPDAVVIGDVVIGEESSVWPGAVLRGDHGRDASGRGGIRIGDRSSVQDGSVLHCTPELTTLIGNDCVIGHIVHLEGCIVEDEALVGNGAIVLHKVIVRTRSLVGANALVPAGMEVPTGQMALGVPARLRDGRPATDLIKFNADTYVERGRRFRAELRRID
jgi:carbonic anhydrase/acetyltransferase-like protein (isoleucine patch superfamily)